MKKLNLKNPNKNNYKRVQPHNKTKYITIVLKEEKSNLKKKEKDHVYFCRCHH